MAERSWVIHHNASSQAASSTAIAPPPRIKARFSRPQSRRAWLGPAVPVVVLVGLLYSRVIGDMLREWWRNPMLWHGFAVVAFVIFLLVQRRREILELPVRPSWAGLGLVTGALLVLLVGVLGSEFFLTRSSLILLLAGLAVYFAGWNHFRQVFVPWAFLFLMIPVPALVLNPILMPLKFLAAKLGALPLKLLGIPLLVSDASIQVSWLTMDILDASRGLDSLMALFALTAMYAYLTEKKMAMRLALMAAVVPALVAASALRVAGAGLLGLWSTGTAEAFYHAYAALGVFACSVLLILAIHRPLRAVVSKASKGKRG